MSCFTIVLPRCPIRVSSCSACAALARARGSARCCPAPSGSICSTRRCSPTCWPTRRCSAGLLAGVGAGDWVVVDEVQRVPSILNEVHRQISERGVRFALLGSSARKLKTAGTNLLAGRALRKAMHPLTAAELGGDFDLDEALRFGTIPLVWTSSDRRATLESYTQLYLREEIRAEAAVRNLGSFVRFLPVAALMHAQTVNAASLARDAGIARTTVNGYLEILTDTLLAAPLPAVAAGLRVRERRRPQAVLGRPGSGARRQAPIRPPSPPRSAARCWRAGCSAASGPTTSSGTSTTTSATGPPPSPPPKSTSSSPATAGTWPSRSRPPSATHTAMGKGLRAVGDLPGLARRILTYRGRRSFRTEDGIDVWTLEDLHRALQAGELWP